MSEQPRELTREDLKIMAYQQKVAELQDLNADMRVDLTVMENDLARLRARLEELEKEANAEKEEATVPDGIDAD